MSYGNLIALCARDIEQAIAVLREHIPIVEILPDRLEEAEGNYDPFAYDQLLQAMAVLIRAHEDQII